MIIALWTIAALLLIGAFIVKVNDKNVDLG